MLERVAPFGEALLNLFHGDSMALLANIHRDDKKKPRPFTLKDFMFDFEPKKPQSNDDLMRIMSAMMSVQNYGKPN